LRRSTKKKNFWLKTKILNLKKKNANYETRTYATPNTTQPTFKNTNEIKIQHEWN